MYFEYYLWEWTTNLLTNLSNISIGVELLANGTCGWNDGWVLDILNQLDVLTHRSRLQGANVYTYRRTCIFLLTRNLCSCLNTTISHISREKCRRLEDSICRLRKCFSWDSAQHFKMNNMNIDRLEKERKKEAMKDIYMFFSINILYVLKLPSLQ